MKKLEGIVPPAVTVFNQDESINEEGFREHLRWLLSHDIGGLSIGGSTGEGWTLTPEELHRIVQIGVEEAKGQVPIVAGVIRDATRDAVRWASAAADAGADFLMVTPIHYYKPDSDAQYNYFRAISDAVPLPLLVYNVIPNAVVTPEQMKRIATLENVVGIKQSGGDIHALSKMKMVLPDDQLVFSAIDSLLYPTYCLGACGAIGLTNTVLPELCVDQWKAFCKGDHKTALDLHFRISPAYWAIDKFNKPAHTKEYLNQRGFKVGVPRSPYHTLPDEDRAEIAEAIRLAKLAA